MKITRNGQTKTQNEINHIIFKIRNSYLVQNKIRNIRNENILQEQKWYCLVSFKNLNVMKTAKDGTGMKQKLPKKNMYENRKHIRQFIHFLITHHK